MFYCGWRCAVTLDNRVLVVAWHLLVADSECVHKCYLSAMMLRSTKKKTHLTQIIIIIIDDGHVQLKQSISAIVAEITIHAQIRKPHCTSLAKKKAHTNNQSRAIDWSIAIDFVKFIGLKIVMNLAATTRTHVCLTINQVFFGNVSTVPIYSYFSSLEVNNEKN